MICPGMINIEGYVSKHQLECEITRNENSVDQSVDAALDIFRWEDAQGGI
jgi:hypothetical protein